MSNIESFYDWRNNFRGELPTNDVYEYKNLSEGLKVQIANVFKSVVPCDIMSYDSFEAEHVQYYESRSKKFYQEFLTTVFDEFGTRANDFIKYDKHLFPQFEFFFISTKDLEKTLYIIKAFFEKSKKYLDEQYENILKDDIYENKIRDRELSIEKLNKRFLEHNMGYQYEHGQIIRIDSQYIHAETVKPVLILLSKPMYKGAQDEFLKAHEHYRKQRYKEMMVECLKAYESTLKVIILKHNWDYREKDTADALTGKVMQNNLVPEYWRQYYKGLKNTLTAGLPTARNNEGGHGQGDAIKNPPDYLAGYVLHMTASAILFLANAEENI